MNVFDLVAKITLDQSEYDESLGESEKKFEGFGAKLKKGLGTAAKIGGAAIAAVGAAGAALTTAVVKGASEMAAYGDNIDKMSQKLGISAQAYQEWDAILQHSGSSIDSMQRGMMTLSNAVVNGSEAFERLGISQEQAASMSQEDLFAAVISGLQNMEEGAERTALAQKLLGGAAKELGPLLNTTAADTEAMRQQLHELGGVMSDEDVKAAAAFQDSLQDMQTAFSGLKRGLMSSFMPSLTTVMDGLRDVFSGNGKTGVAAISEGIDDLVTNISDRLPAFIDLGLGILDSLTNAVIENLPKLMESAGEIIGKLIAGIVAALPRLIEQAPQIIMAVIRGLRAAWPEIKAAGIELLTVIWTGIKSGLGKLSSKAGEIWDAIKGKAVAKWEEIKANVSAVVESMRSAIAERFDAIKTKIASVVDAVKGKFETFKQAAQSVKTKFEEVAKKIRAVFNFDFKMPHIKLPHFKVDPEGWKIGDLLRGVTPTLSIQWYRKAYDEPYMFTEPTVMRGFGDGNGGEMVYGRDNLMRDIREATEGSNASRIDYIIDLLEHIVRNGLNANIDKSAVYRSVSQENRTRTKATNYNLLAAR